MKHTHISGRSMRRGPISPRNRQRGLTLLEMSLYAALVFIVGGAIVAGFANVQSGSRTELGISEIMKVKVAAETYRSAAAQGGSYNLISVEVLADNGYNVEPLTDGDDENVYGMDITVAPAAGGTDATLTYGFSSQPDCEQAVDRLTGTTGVKTTPTCTTAGLFTVTLE